MWIMVRDKEITEYTYSHSHEKAMKGSAEKAVTER